MTGKRPRGRPRKILDSRPNLVGGAEEKTGELSTDYRENLAGVSVQWLSIMFGMDKTTVKKRLAGCPELRRGKGDVPLFALAQAASYLVKPNIDIVDWMKTLRPADLPPYLQAEFWDAQNKRQKWEENAGELWRTEKVINVFADVFKLIKETMQLWADGLDRKEGLTLDQRKVLTQMIDGLQDDLHEKLVEFGKNGKTVSSVAELKDIEEAENVRETLVKAKQERAERPELV